MRGTLEQSAKRAGKSPAINELWVAGARDAINAGDNDKHDRLIAEQSAAAGDFDTDRAEHDLDGAGARQDAARARAKDADQRR